MLKKISTFFITSFICIFPSVSHALDWVIDWAAEANTLHTFEELQRHYDVINKSKDYLDTAQNMLTQKIGIDKINLAALTPQQLQALLKNAQDTITPYNGAAPFTQEAAFNQFYTLPTDPNIVEAQLTGILDSKQVKAMVEAAKAQKLRHDLFIEGINQAKKEKSLSTKRMNDINYYGQQIQQLGDQSSLKTAQVTASQINYSLQQQEQVIKQSQEQLQYARLQKAEEESEKAKVAQALQTKIQEVSNQGTTGLGRDRWGDL